MARKGAIKVQIVGTIEDVDLGFENLLKLLNFLGGEQVSVDVGLPEGTSEEVLFKGIVNEFGSPAARVPSRPWFTSTIDANTDRYLKILSDMFWKSFRNPDAKKTGNDIRVAVAEAIVRDLKASISDRKWWPQQAPTARNNRPSTIEKKKFDHPLFETGELLAAIRYEMKNRNKG